MAEGGGFENPAFDPEVNPDEWAPDDDEQDPNETTPFIPGSASTPGPPGEEIPMQTMQHEQSGLSPVPSYEETSFGGRNITNE